METTDRASRLNELVDMYNQAIAGLEQEGGSEALLADIERLRQETLDEIEALRTG